MKVNVKSIGIVDKHNKIQKVDFNKGINIITGKSSTGKSAIIEIFDYCFGSSDFTIPHGVITQNAQLYFTILNFDERALVLARGTEEKMRNAFIKEFDDIRIEINNITFFEQDYFIPLNDYKIELGKYLGLDFENTTENLQEASERMNKPRPTIRNYMSFMLQHQNLVANKHALFYRFDEKEKREQCIDQFKIYAGFVDQNYYILKQKLNDLKLQLSREEKIDKRNIEEKEMYQKKIDSELLQYRLITGNDLFDDGINGTNYANPKKYIDTVQKRLVAINYESNEYLKERKRIINELSNIEAERRKLENKKVRVDASIESIQKYESELNEYSRNSEEYAPIKCPICHSERIEQDSIAEKLVDSYNWINQELQKTPYMTRNFLSTQLKLEKDINDCNQKIGLYAKELMNIDNIIKKLDKKISLEMQAQSRMASIIGLLENLLDIFNQGKNTLKQGIEKQINDVEKELDDNYNVSSKLIEAEKAINKYMNKIGEKLAFEDYYKPLDLRFSLETFDLYNYKNNKKVFLRSMGSGANWLYSHICLFLAIQNYFCSNEKSTMPPILFIDQPSQVYFPATPLDTTWEDTLKKAVDVKTAEKKDKGLAQKKKDEDLEAVTNLYDVIVEHCVYTEEKTGIRPQIIITDHADNLKLKNAVFEELVDRRRWRDRGFIIH